MLNSLPPILAPPLLPIILRLDFSAPDSTITLVTSFSKIPNADPLISIGAFLLSGTTVALEIGSTETSDEELESMVELMLLVQYVYDEESSL